MLACGCVIMFWAYNLSCRPITRLFCGIPGCVPHILWVGYFYQPYPVVLPTGQPLLYRSHLTLDSTTLTDYSLTVTQHKPVTNNHTSLL